MDSLFGIPLSSYLIALTLLVGLIFGLLGWIWWRNPLLVRMGLRNVARRKTQTSLILIGLMLSTLIMSAAFATGDTVGYSITNAVYRDFGKADIVIAFDRDAAPAGVEGLADSHVRDLQEAFSGDPDVEGITGIVQLRVPAVNLAERRAEPRAVFAGVDPASVDVFEGLMSPDGDPLSASVLGGERVYVTEMMQEKTGIGLGERFTVFFENRPVEFEVAGVVRDNAFTAQTALSGGELGELAGGVVTNIETLREMTANAERADRIDLIVMTVQGGVRDSLDNIGPVQDRVEAYIESSGAPIQVVITKSEAVGFAELIGSIFVTFFIVFGLFSIAAGVMLIFLTFVMLAAERRSEMGMARAVGMRRTHLTESFIAEGMAYNIGAALIGALLGVAVAFGIVFAMSRLFADLGFDVTFHFNPQGFAIAYFLGVVITFATVAFSSWRAANLNIVRAIRDLPEPELFRASDRSIGRLARAVLAAVWDLAWIVLITLWAIAAFQLFILGLATYGAAMLGGLLLAGAYAWGVGRVGRGWSNIGRWGRVGYVAWWLVFSILAAVTWLLFRTRSWAGRHRSAGGWAVWMLAIGVLAIWWGGWESGQAFAYTGGTTLALLAAAMLAVYFGAPTRPAFTIASVLLLWYWLLPLPFSLFVEDASRFMDPLGELFALFGLPTVEMSADIEMFFVSGICITAAATLFVIFNADRILNVLQRASGALGGIAPAVRTAVAYPLAAKFRTAMTLAMFGLVVFSLVVMATLNYNFSQLFLGEDAKGGFDVSVSANPSNRIPDLREALAEADYDVDQHITGVGTLLTAQARMRVAEEDAEFAFYRLQGADDEFIDLARFPLVARAAGYESDEAVWEAIRNDPTLAIVDESRTAAQQGFGGPQTQFHLGVRTGQLQDRAWDPIPIVVRDDTAGAEVELNVIGVIQPQVTAVTPDWFAVFVHRSLVEEQLDGGVSESFFLRTTDPTTESAVEVASSIEAALLERGVLATSLQRRIDDQAAQSTAFQYLFEGFMGLGLIVGIAALGVIAFRTVAERRQQIGMLRAIGYTRRLVGLSFFLESSFIALTGILMGLTLGAALSYNLLSSPEFVGEAGAEIDFAMPWLRLLVIVAIAYGASALMTLIPARSASRVPVAEALRYAG